MLQLTGELGAAGEAEASERAGERVCRREGLAVGVDFLSRARGRGGTLEDLQPPVDRRQVTCPDLGEGGVDASGFSWIVHRKVVLIDLSTSHPSVPKIV